MIGGSRRTQVALTISADVANYNVRTAAGSPTGAVDVIVTIDAGVEVYSTSTATRALRIGTGWTVGSSFLIVNNGTILGAGGAGGPQLATDGGPGGNAGDAMGCDGFAVTIANGGGNIWGGGGGGGAGGSASSFGKYGGGGGGGAGRNGGGAGSSTGSAGTAGTSGGPGAGGGADMFGHAGVGGNGGDFGVSGANGGVGSWPGLGAGGNGGNGGKAIDLGGGSVTFTSGNNSSQVRGIVT